MCVKHSSVGTVRELRLLCLMKKITTATKFSAHPSKSRLPLPPKHVASFTFSPMVFASFTWSQCTSQALAGIVRMLCRLPLTPLQSELRVREEEVIN